jgi:hypothetical protein
MAYLLTRAQQPYFSMSELRRALTIDRGWRHGHIKIRSFNINGDEEFHNFQSDHQQKPIVVKADNGIGSATIRGNGTLNFKAKKSHALWN